LTKRGKSIPPTGGKTHHRRKNHKNFCNLRKNTEKNQKTTFITAYSLIGISVIAFIVFLILTIKTPKNNPKITSKNYAISNIFCNFVGLFTHKIIIN
jgi:hypothetical protein